MLRLCYYDIQRNLWISRLCVEGSNWNKRISTLYRCHFVPETKYRKSNFMLVICSVYAIMIFSEVCEISRLWVEGSNWNKRISTLYRCLFVSETKNRTSNFMLVLCSVYAIMLVSELCEYLGSELKVPTEINGFLLSIDASLYQKRKIENLISCWFYAQFMLLWYSANLWISRLWVGGSNWNKRISTLYRCLFVPETKNRKSNFMLSLCYYASERNFRITRLWVEGSNWNKRISTLYRWLFVPETKNRKSNFMLILCSGYAIMLVSELCEYLGSELKVLTEINGFLLSIDASLHQKRKIENLILCWFYAQLCYYASERNLWIPRLWVEGSNWN